MSLRLKFLIVLALLGLTLSVNVALSIWSIRFLERELAWPLQSAQPVLYELHKIKRLGEQEVGALGAGRAGSDDAADAPALSDEEIGQRLLTQERQAHEALRRLEALPTVNLRSGVSTTQNLRDRSHEIMRLIEGWASKPSDSQRVVLIESIDTRHELIERVEGRILQDAQLTADYGRRLKVVIYLIISASVLGAGLTAGFVVLLLRRWVLAPVGALREGAKRFGSGAFTHRIAINTDDELGQLGEEFNHMASLIKTMQDERIERERLAAMGEMAQRTVHNLRTPLSGIRALAEMTSHELPEGSDLTELQDRIIATVDRFEGWLQGMLRVSSPLQLQHQTYSPRKLVEGVVGAHRDAAKSAGGVIINLADHGVPDRAVGDPNQLEHALTALVGNAIDFSPEGGVISVDIGDTEGGYWTLSVQDQGPGIEPGLHVAIFRPYFTTRKSGTGIGLAMVRRIVEQHHGTIAVQSPQDPDSGTGTRFVCQIKTLAASDPG